MPTATWKSRLRSGSAHWDLELAVEVRQCPLGSGARGGGPAAPTGIWTARRRRRVRRPRRRRWRRTRRRRRRRRTALIRSNNPHLAGGEKNCLSRKAAAVEKAAAATTHQTCQHETLRNQTQEAFRGPIQPKKHLGWLQTKNHLGETKQFLGGYICPSTKHLLRPPQAQPLCCSMLLPDCMPCMCSSKNPKTVQNPFSKVSLLQSLFQRFLFHRYSAKANPFSKVPFCTGIVQRRTLFQRFLFCKGASAKASPFSKAPFCTVCAAFCFSPSLKGIACTFSL